MLASVFLILGKVMKTTIWVIQEWKFKFLLVISWECFRAEQGRMQAYAGFLSQILAIKWHPMTGNHELSFGCSCFSILHSWLSRKNSQHLSKEKVKLTEETCLQNFGCNSVLLSSIKWFCVEDDGSIITCLWAINTAFSSKFYPWYSENRPAIINICINL